VEFLVTQIKVRTQTIAWVQRSMYFGVAKEVTWLYAFLNSEEFISFLFSPEFIFIKASKITCVKWVKTKMHWISCSFLMPNKK